MAPTHHTTAATRGNVAATIGAIMSNSGFTSRTVPADLADLHGAIAADVIATATDATPLYPADMVGALPTTDAAKRDRRDSFATERDGTLFHRPMPADLSTFSPNARGTEYELPDGRVVVIYAVHSASLAAHRAHYTRRHLTADGRGSGPLGATTDAQITTTRAGQARAQADSHRTMWTNAGQCACGCKLPHADGYTADDLPKWTYTDADHYAADMELRAQQRA